jgi:mannose-1-phosphate guanylyltransferase/phosphomannomutase
MVLKGLILSAGEGTRLRPMTNDVPKVMVEIDGRPLLEWHVRLFKHYGISDITLNIFHKKEVIKDHFKDGSAFGVKIHYLEEETLSGTAGAVKKLESWLDTAFVVQYGDVAANYDIGKFADFHKNCGGIATLFVYKTCHPYDSDITVMNDDSRIIDFKRVKEGDAFVNLANSGAYIMEPEICSYIEPARTLDFGRDIFPNILKGEKLRIHGYYSEEYTMDMGTYDRYVQVKKDLDAGKFVFIE